MPSFMLSEFMFPFRGMPISAQWLGNVFPHHTRHAIVRGMLLKGVGWPEIAPELWPMALFTVVVIAFATLVCRETLD
jgi:ABC-2 type transport system permease protein